MAPLAAAFAILWGWIAVAKSLPESLWVDELHSTWTATGTSGEVFHRAALGNQLCTYFWLLRWLGQTFGTGEAVWRAPSVAAWLGIVALCAAGLGRWAGRSGRPVALLGLALLVLDRLQIFYATEARPYALVALVILLSWFAMAAWSSRWFPAAGVRRGLYGLWAMWFAWCVLNVLACWLQPTAVLSVAAQYAYLISLGFGIRLKGQHLERQAFERQVTGNLWPIALGALVFVLSMLPALHVLWPVWEHRQRWAAFASGTGPGDVLLLLPFTAFLGPLVIGALLHALLGRGFRSLRDQRAEDQRGQENMPGQHPVLAWFALDATGPVGDSAGRRQWWMWLAAWSLPCLLVYVLTASGVAPLMHRRYVFTAAAPFVLWIASSVVALRGGGLRLCVFCAMFAILLVEQNSVSVWLRGGWPTAVRGEDWRGAAEWINSQTDHEEPIVVFCASNLIEGAGQVPAERTMREYLTLPLRSVYRVEAAKRIVPLANDPLSWASAVADERLPPSVPVWLVVRSSAEGLERRLQTSGLSVGERRSFGGVQVAQDVGFKKNP